MANKTMGEMIAALRREKGMTQKELAERLNITDKAVSKWERDLACPDTQTIPKLAEILGLSVEENLRAGAHTLKTREINGVRVSAKQQLNDNFERVYQLFPRLKERAKQPSGTLSGGEQQMLAIGRALMGSPRMLVLDEPSLGLAPLLIRDIFEALQKIRSEGTTILIVEQNALATLKIADKAYVLELGKISMSGPADVLIHDEKLVEAYLGNKKN